MTKKLSSGWLLWGAVLASVLGSSWRSLSLLSLVLLLLLLSISL